jgi:DNA-binding protein Fis
MGELEHKLIVAVLRKVGGNQVRTAQALGISRVMLHDRIKRYGIRTEVIVHDDRPPSA